MVRSRDVVQAEGSARTEGARRATGVRADGAAAGAGALAPGQRWSASRKRDVVLRLLRGESLEALSREAGVEIYRLEAWRERAMAGTRIIRKGSDFGSQDGVIVSRPKDRTLPLSSAGHVGRKIGRMARCERPAGQLRRGRSREAR